MIPAEAMALVTEATTPAAAGLYQLGSNIEDAATEKHGGVCRLLFEDALFRCLKRETKAFRDNIPFWCLVASKRNSVLSNMAPVRIENKGRIKLRCRKRKLALAPKQTYCGTMVEAITFVGICRASFTHPFQTPAAASLVQMVLRKEGSGKTLKVALMRRNRWMSSMGCAFFHKTGWEAKRLRES